MTAGTMKAAQLARIAGREIADFAEKRGDTDLARDIPHADSDIGSFVSCQQLATIRLVDRCEVERPARSQLDRLRDPQRDGVALDYLVDRRVDRLDQMIA